MNGMVVNNNMNMVEVLKWNIKCPGINKDSVSYEERRHFDKCQNSINTIKQVGIVIVN